MFAHSAALATQNPNAAGGFSHKLHQWAQMLTTLRILFVPICVICGQKDWGLRVFLLLWPGCLLRALWVQSFGPKRKQARPRSRFSNTLVAPSP